MDIPFSHVALQMVLQLCMPRELDEALFAHLIWYVIDDMVRKNSEVEH